MIKRLLAFLTKKRRFCLPSKHHLMHAEHYTHMGYLGLVSWESHYLYGKVALVGFTIAVVSLFVRDSDVAEHMAEDL